MITVLNILIVLSMGFVPFPAFGDTTFTNSTVESVDQEGRQLTIRTADGTSWSLPVERVELMKGLERGDRVSLEIGSDDQVNKIVKSQSRGSERPSRNELSEY